MSGKLREKLLHAYIFEAALIDLLTMKAVRVESRGGWDDVESIHRCAPGLMLVHHSKKVRRKGIRRIDNCLIPVGSVSSERR